MSLVAVGAILVAFVLDAAAGEPPDRLHPVAWFGSVVSVCDRGWRFPRAAGLLVAALLPLVAAVVAGGTVALADTVAPGSGVAPLILVGGIAGVWLFVTMSRRMLHEVAEEVLEATDTDPDRARESIRALVGREAAPLSPDQLRSATVESAAENLADGLVAPLLAFALGAQVSLPVAVGAAAWVKAVNTLDSMLGYPQKPHGSASARLDDLVMWMPARLSAGFLSLVALDPAALGRARAWTDAPPSPNSGWPMATLAAILDVRLEKPGAYTINGGRPLPMVDQARRGLRVVDRAAVLAFAASGVVAWV
jgi:adenosylcobinamide-phosphate synthase